MPCEDLQDVAAANAPYVWHVKDRGTQRIFAQTQEQFIDALILPAFRQRSFLRFLFGQGIHCFLVSR